MITESQVVAALRAFILSVVTCEVIRAQTNRVPMPKGDFVALNVVGESPLSTNVDSYTPPGKNILRPAKLSIQVDCYGASAHENAQAISALLRDDYAVQSFLSSGIDAVPLYAEDARQMPLITGEDQYLERWTFIAEIQYNPVYTVSQQFEAVPPVVKTIEVDSTYPP